MRKEIALSLLCLLGCLSCIGCVQRTLTVRTEPEGALVYLNDQEVGRTPFTRSFTWYGIYDLEVHKEGYESLKTTVPLIAPWWQWAPFDFFAELFPLTDHHEMTFTLRPPSEQEQDSMLLLRRAEQLRGELQSGQKPPTTRPHEHKKPTTRPATRPATQPAE